MKKNPSGKFVLRLPPELHAALRNGAAGQGISLNEYCLRVLRDRLEGGPVAGGLSVPESEAGPIVARLRETMGPGLRGVVLFGSTARGEARAESDVDLLIVLRPETPLTRGLYHRWDETAESGRLSPHFVHLPESVSAAGSIWLEAAVDGIVLFDPGRAVARFLARIRRAMARGELERRNAYGHPYWIRHGQEVDRAQ